MFTLNTKKSILKALITKRSPYYVQYFINNRCTLRCKHCNIVNTNTDCQVASLEQVNRIAENLKKIGGGIVLLTGGEPFLRNDLPEMVRIFRSHKLDVRLQTAGFRVATSDKLSRCFENGARDINISLDSLDSSKQDYINGVRGSWDEALKTIANVLNIFRESAICSFGCVLSRFNYAEIPYILEFANTIGWYLSLVPVHITTPDIPMGFRSQDSDFSFQPDDFPEIEQSINTILDMKRRGYKLFDAESFLLSSLNFIRTGNPAWRKNDVCDSPFLYFVIRPNGDMAVCCDYEIPGESVSLLDPEFPQKYKSQDLIRRVQAVTRACPGCHYGSYPEVTISVRNFRAFLARTRITLKSVHKQLKPYTYDELLDIVHSIKQKAYPLYEKSLNPGKYNNRIILEYEQYVISNTE